MNWAVIRSFGFITSFISAVTGLLVTQGVVLSGSTADHVIGWIITILGAVGGHHLASGSSTEPKA